MLDVFFSVDIREGVPKSAIVGLMIAMTGGRTVGHSLGVFDAGGGEALDAPLHGG